MISKLLGLWGTSDATRECEVPFALERCEVAFDPWVLECIFEGKSLIFRNKGRRVAHEVAIRPSPISTVLHIARSVKL